LTRYPAADDEMDFLKMNDEKFILRGYLRNQQKKILFLKERRE
jgi:hypothetical protein